MPIAIKCDVVRRAQSAGPRERHSATDASANKSLSWGFGVTKDDLTDAVIPEVTHCEPRAIRDDGTIDPRECLSCMDCEATYRNEQKCPPLLAITRLETVDTLDARQQTKLADLRQEAADV